MQNQAVRRGGAAGARTEEFAAYDDYDLRAGHHYDQAGRPQVAHGYPDEEPVYDPRAYAPNPDEPYGYDQDGNPLYYEYEPDRRSLGGGGRSGLMMVGAVLAVALVGGAGVVGYKMLGSGGANGEAPLIRADTEPVKTVPEKSETAQQPSKAVYDRVDAGGQANSKVVSREEEPVDLPAPSAAPRNEGARIILPQGAATAERTAPSTNGEGPRKVKTMTIRPDGSMAEAPAAPAGAAAPAADPIAEAARTGEAPRSDFDDGIMAEGPAQPERAAPQPEQRVAATPKAAPAAAPKAAPKPAAPARTELEQVAAVAPRAPAPTPSPARAAAGGYVVQVSSQRSEEEARAAFASLQKRFPQVLGSYQASIQSATVGDRGTYYRVRVGPFGSSTDASTVCNNLRAAGGDCVVARN